MVSGWLVAPVVADESRNNAGANAADELPWAILLLGPTASGKTALALALAQHLGAEGQRAEIVSCDSVAVYRGMDIGSAKPDAAERAAVPHHLLDVVDPDTEFTAGDYARQARAALRAIAARGAVPLVTGGTGLYLRALVQGLFAGPQRDPELRSRLLASQARHEASRQQQGSSLQQSSWLHRLLQRLDPAAAERIHPNDTPKLIRALEVRLRAQRPMSHLLAEGREALTGFRLLRIGLQPPRDALYARIDQRAAQMFARGLVAETRTLLDRFGAVRPLEALGYRQAQALLRGELSESAAIAAAQQGHRNYAKRQLTWFRKEPDVHWIQDFGDSPAALAAARGLLPRRAGWLR